MYFVVALYAAKFCVINAHKGKGNELNPWPPPSNFVWNHTQMWLNLKLKVPLPHPLDFQPLYIYESWNNNDICLNIFIDPFWSNLNGFLFQILHHHVHDIGCCLDHPSSFLLWTRSGSWREQFYKPDGSWKFRLWRVDSGDHGRPRIRLRRRSSPPLGHHLNLNQVKIEMMFLNSKNKIVVI